MRFFIYLASFSLIGFALSLLVYFGFNLARWSLVSNSYSQDNEGAYLKILVSSVNKNPTVLGVKDEKPSPGLVKRNFSLSVPSLNIENARVESNVSSSKEEVYFPVLKHSIAHYEGTALPGEKGNVFLYGHSVLPTFYDPKDYLTIFSNLSKVKIGEEVVLSDYPRAYKYIIFEKRVVDPSALQFLNPHPYSTVTLMTCVPPGMTTKRLLVIGRLLN